MIRLRYVALAVTLLAAPGTAWGADPEVERVRDIEYARAGGRALKLDIIRRKEAPPGLAPAVVWIHGGGWEHGSKEGGPPVLLKLAARGFFCASVEYRLTGEAPFPAQIDDCKAAVRWLRAHAAEYRVDPERIGVFGASAGGHLAALVGTSGGAPELDGAGEGSTRVAAVVDWFGPADLAALEGLRGADSAVAKLVGGPVSERKEVCRRASPVTYATKDDPPFLIVHGDKDPLVPLDQSRRLLDALRKAGVDAQLEVVEGAGHGFQGHPEVDEKVLRFFEERLGVRRGARLY